jgi:2'-5' RNA ligase
VYSVNVPVPGRVQRLAADMRPALARFDTVRERHTLVVKRLGDGDPDRLAARVREVLRGTQPFPCRVTGIDAFADPPTESAPVLYLAIDGPMQALHDRLTEIEPPVDDIEGPDYTPHVTLARGADIAPNEVDERGVPLDLARAPVETEWTVDELWLWSTAYREPVARIRLPV